MPILTAQPNFLKFTVLNEILECRFSPSR